MSSTVTDVIQAAIDSNSYDAISTTVGALMIGLLIVLLTSRELARAYALPQESHWVRMLGTIAGPLLLAFSVVVGFRLLGLLL